MAINHLAMLLTMLCESNGTSEFFLEGQLLAQYNLRTKNLVANHRKTQEIENSVFTAAIGSRFVTQGA
jgi:hypothetical protein